MRNKRKRPAIRLLSLGEGASKGNAALHAEKLLLNKKPGKIIAVDLAAAEYKTPSNMTHIKGNAFSFLRRLQPESVGIVRDDLFFHEGTICPEANSLEDIARVASDALNGKRPLNITRNAEQYVRAVKRVLIPGGRFILTAYSEESFSLADFLRRAGFKVSFRALSPAEVEKHGSRFAKRNAQDGSSIVRISARKLLREGTLNSPLNVPEYLRALHCLRDMGKL